MTRMTRTQISLAEDQYRYLKKEAAGRGMSLSAVLREMVVARMREQRDMAPSITSIYGMFSDGTISGADHDRILSEGLAIRKLSEHTG